MTIYTFSGKHRMENIFYRCSVSTCKHFHRYKPIFGKHWEAMSLPFHRLVNNFSFNEQEINLCYLKGEGFIVRIARDWSRRVRGSISEPTWGTACSPVYPSGAPQPLWSLCFSLHDSSIFSLYWLPPLIPILEPNYIWINLTHIHL